MGGEGGSGLPCVVFPGTSPLAVELTLRVPAAGEVVQSCSPDRPGLWSGPAGAALCYSDQIPSSSGGDALQMVPHEHRCCWEGAGEAPWAQAVSTSARITLPD